MVVNNGIVFFGHNKDGHDASVVGVVIVFGNGAVLVHLEVWVPLCTSRQVGKDLILQPCRLDNLPNITAEFCRCPSSEVSGLDIYIYILIYRYYQS